MVEDDLDDKVQDEGLNDVEWMLELEDVDEVVLLDHHRSGMSLLNFDGNPHRHGPLAR